MARRLSSSTARRWPSSAVVKNPPRHKLDTRRPESATMAAASFSPTSATGSRHSPMLAMPASRVTRSAVAKSAYWLSPRNELLLTEDRRVRARIADRGWVLELVTTLTNAAGRPIALGSPATNGREGAGYGGLFWRLPPAKEPRVRTADADGEHALHGRVAPSLAWFDPGCGFTLVFAGTDESSRADPWFVRVEDYPGVGLQLAAHDPVTLGAGGSVTRGLCTLIDDGAVDDRVIAEVTATSG
jgi:hypothetical protein